MRGGTRGRDLGLATLDPGLAGRDRGLVHPSPGLIVDSDRGLALGAGCRPCLLVLLLVLAFFMAA